MTVTKLQHKKAQVNKGTPWYIIIILRQNIASKAIEFCEKTQNKGLITPFKVIIIIIIFFAHWYFIPRGLEINKV